MASFSGDSKYKLGGIQLNIKDKSVNFKFVLAVCNVFIQPSQQPTARKLQECMYDKSVIIGKNGCPVELLWKSSEG